MDSLVPGYAGTTTRRLYRLALFLVLGLGCSGLATAARVAPVLPPSSAVTAVTAYGPITVSALDGVVRVYRFFDTQRRVMLVPSSPLTSRAGWLYTGLSGAAQPGASPITRVRALEAWHDFDSFDDARIWMQIRRLHFAYNDRGLVVGWKPEGDTLHVEVWRFTIKGRAPQYLPGSDNHAVRLAWITQAH